MRERGERWRSEAETATHGEHLAPAQREVVRLFALSFRFSQGHVPLQDDLFRWLLAHQQLPPHLDDVAVRDVCLRLRVPVTHKPIEGLLSRTGELELQLNRLGSLRADTQSGREALPDPAMLLARITLAMLTRDLAYQFGPRSGRIVDAEVPPLPDSERDPYASLVRRHAVLHLPAGHPAYTSLFADIGEQLTAWRPLVAPPPRHWLIDERGRAKLAQLRQHWDDHHPGERFFPDDAYELQLPLPDPLSLVAADEADDAW